LGFTCLFWGACIKNPAVPNAADSTVAVEPEMVRAQLERILGSPGFATAKSARRFVRYVVEETLAGRSDQIKEYVVGVAVFDRGDDYDPRADAVVRVEATRLRNRLRDYYQGDGLADPVSIELPKGSYVPVFRSLRAAPPVKRPSWRQSRRALAWAAVGICALLTLSIMRWERSQAHVFAQVQSVAVLPFENLSGDSSQDYLADGITEGLTTELGRIRKLRVISHAAVADYKNAAKPRSEIANELKVDAWVEGSVVRTGNKVRIAERLVQPRTLRRLWSQSYERDVSEILALQRDAARNIAARIGQEGPPGEKTQSGDELRVNPEAYDYYLRGRFHSQHQTEGENAAAISNLERAVAIDPSFALAYAELAQTYVWRLFLFAPAERQWEEKAFVAAEKALALDPDLAAAHVARGRLLWTPANHFPHEKAIREYRRALASDASLDEARNQLALIYCHIGFFDQALEESRKAVLTNPNNNLAVYRTAQALAFRGQYEEALTILHGIPEEVNPSLVGYQTAWVLFNLGKRQEASAKIAQLLRDHPEDSGGLFTSMQAVLAAAAGDKPTAEAKIRVAVEKGKGFGHFHHTAYHIATAFALIRNPGQAIHWLKAAAEDGFPCYPLFESDHNLDNLRQNARFMEFMAEQKQQWVAYKTLF
jgi:TolB-like protein/Tfp pilus assembly protein PilF